MTEFDDLLIDAYRGELLGDALFGAMREGATDDAQRERLGALQQIEGHTATRLRALIDASGIDAGDEQGPRESGAAMASSALDQTWLAFLTGLRDGLPSYLVGFERLRSIGAPGDPILAELVAHEHAIAHFAELEAAGRSTDALAVLEHHVAAAGVGSEIAERYERIAAGFDARLEGCREEQWSRPSPCSEWTTAAIIEHVIGVHRRILETLGEDDGGADVADSGLRAAWSDASGNMQRALRDRARASKVVVTRFGEMAFEELASRMACSDTLVHTWDLARATGQDEHLDARAVEFAWTWMEPAGERLRASGDFGPAVVPPPDADTQTRLLCFLGRDPAAT